MRPRNSRHQHQIIPRRPLSVSPLGSLPSGLQGVQYSNEEIPNVPTSSGNDLPIFNAADIGREVHDVIVAAADAPDSWKAIADYICDGTNDTVMVQRAIDHAATGYNYTTEQEEDIWLPSADDAAATGGDEQWWGANRHVRLSPGRFVMTNNITIYCAGFKGSNQSVLVLDNANIWSYRNSDISPETTQVFKDFTIIQTTPTNSSIYYHGEDYQGHRTVFENVNVYGGNWGLVLVGGVRAIGCSVKNIRGSGIELYEDTVVDTCVATNCDLGFYAIGNYEDSILTNSWVIYESQIDSEFEPRTTWLRGPVGIMVSAGIAQNCKVYMDSNLDYAAGIVLEGYGRANRCLVSASFTKQTSVGIVAIDGYGPRYKSYITNCSIDMYYNGAGGQSGIHAELGWQNSNFDREASGHDGPWLVIENTVLYERHISAIDAHLYLYDNLLYGIASHSQHQPKYAIDAVNSRIVARGNIIDPTGAIEGLIDTSPASGNILYSQDMLSPIEFTVDKASLVLSDKTTGGRYNVELDNNTLRLKPTHPRVYSTAENSSSSSTLITVNAPQSFPGDTLLFIAQTRWSTPNPSGPDGPGWSEVFTQTFSSGSHLTIWRKQATSNEPSEYTMTKTSGAYIASVSVWRGLGPLLHAAASSNPQNTAPSLVGVEDGIKMHIWGYTSTSFASFGTTKGTFESLIGNQSDSILHDSLIAEWLPLLEDGQTGQGLIVPKTVQNVTSNNIAATLTFQPIGKVATFPIAGEGGEYESEGLYLVSPNGTRYRVTINDDGTLRSTTSTASSIQTGRAFVDADSDVDSFGTVSMSSVGSQMTVSTATTSGLVAMTATATTTSTGDVEALGSTTSNGIATVAATADVEAFGSSSNNGTATLVATAL